MVLPQRVTADETFGHVPPMLTAAAAAYRRARSAEAAQLALMAQQDLGEPWTEAVRATVLTARQRIHEAESAREDFRGRIREFVVALRDAGEPASSALRHTRSVIHVLESAGAVEGDRGRTETEVLAWAIEAYESR